MEPLILNAACRSCCYRSNALAQSGSQPFSKVRGPSGPRLTETLTNLPRQPDLYS